MVFAPLRGEQTNSLSRAAVPPPSIKSRTAVRQQKSLDRIDPTASASLGFGQPHRDVRRGANHAGTSIRIGAAFEHFQQKKEFLGEHVRILRWV